MFNPSNTIPIPTFESDLINELRRAVLAQDFEFLRAVAEVDARLEALGFDMEIPGYPAFTDREMLERFRSFLTMVRDLVN